MEGMVISENRVAQGNAHIQDSPFPLNRITSIFGISFPQEDALYDQHSLG